ncbi:MAG: MBL fold metallo-hydrolase [Candidatus Rokuibacteriota bacterium]
MRRHLVHVLAIAIVVLFIVDFSSLGAQPPASGVPKHHLRRGFQNLDSTYAYPLAERAKRFLRRTFEGWPPRGQAPAVLPNDGAELRANGQIPTLTWIGHSTFLIQLQGINVLTDPHWGERASPVAFAGPRRLVPPGMRFEDLPRVQAVLISHDHYDHLDTDTVERLVREHQPTFFAPLGVGELLRDMGARSVVELDWWQSAAFRGLTFVCTPAQHSSGRGLHDQNLRLWSSWVIRGATRRLFFGGDTGYWSGLVEIGRRLGPFDVAALPIGGYSTWQPHPNHLNPEEAVQLFDELGGGLMVPMHWGTFELNVEPYREPPERMFAEALRRGLEEKIAPLSPGESIEW